MKKPHPGENNQPLWFPWVDSKTSRGSSALTVEGMCSKCQRGSNLHHQRHFGKLWPKDLDHFDDNWLCKRVLTAQWSSDSRDCSHILSNGFHLDQNWLTQFLWVCIRWSNQFDFYSSSVKRTLRSLLLASVSSLILKMIQHTVVLKKKTVCDGSLIGNHAESSRATWKIDSSNVGVFGPA